MTQTDSASEALCPEVDVLGRLALGVPSPDDKALEDHLMDCPRCAARLVQMPARDGLTEAMRQSRTVEREAAVETLAEELIARLTFDTTEEFGPPDLSFLAPPQRPDELGRLGGHRILGVLGSGGMGLVFLAEEEDLGRQVALKVIRPEVMTGRVRDRFLREARAAAALNHDNIIGVIRSGEDAGVPFLTMPLLKGETLAERLRRQHPLPLPLIVQVGREAASALAAAHAAGIVHRDVKPSNIWLEERPDGVRVRLLDFGLAWDESAAGALTGSGVLVGTPQYMAPEQARGERIDGGADLFALGCVLYEACTGRRPFDAPSVMAVLSALATRNPEPAHVLNSEVPRPLSDLVRRLMAKDRRRRPRNAVAVINDLEWIARQTFAPPRRLTRRIAAVALTVAALMLAGVIVVTVTPPGGEPVEGLPTEDSLTVIAADGTLTIPPSSRPAVGSEVPPPPSAGAPVADFAIAHGMTREEFDRWLARLPEGYLIHWMDVRAFGKDVRFSGVATSHADAVAREFRHHLPVEPDGPASKNLLITKDWNDALARKFRMVWDWQYPDGDGLFRSRLYRKDGVPFSMLHATPENIAHVTRDALHKGSIVQAITPNLRPESRAYLVTLANTKRPCKYSILGNHATLPDYVKEIEGKGWGVDQLTAYELDGVERFIVIVSENAGKPAHTVEWGITPEKLDSRIAEQRKNGLMPWCLTAYESREEEEYAVVWCPYEGKKKQAP